jgi:hypothetical protein
MFSSLVFYFCPYIKVWKIFFKLLRIGKIEILGRKKKCEVEEIFSKKGLAQPRPIYKGLNGLKPKGPIAFGFNRPLLLLSTPDPISFTNNLSRNKTS